MVEAADIFNSSDYRRTVGGIAKSLGEPRASIVPLSGVSGELVVTVAWDISWYQYRVTPESAQPVRLAERGHELGELEAATSDWNARIEQDGRLVPEIARSSADRIALTIRSVIYCVIPPELDDELYDKMVEYYKDNPNVTVIIDRRKGPGPAEPQGAATTQSTRSSGRPATGAAPGSPAPSPRPRAPSE